MASVNCSVQATSLRGPMQIKLLMAQFDMMILKFSVM